MKRGDILFAQLSPTKGSEIRKTRPVLIVSNNANNKVASTITVVPLTSNVTKIYPFEVFLPSKKTHLSKDAKAQCQQIRTISKERLKGKVAGRINKELMEKINAGISLHLDLD